MPALSKSLASASRAAPRIGARTVLIPRLLSRTRYTHEPGRSLHTSTTHIVTPHSQRSARSARSQPSANGQCLQRLFSTTSRAQFSATPPARATLMQVLRGCRTQRRPPRPTSPALSGRPHMKGVCLKVGLISPKKPNSGERKFARVKLSSGKVVSAIIPGEGKNPHRKKTVTLLIQTLFK